MNVFPGYFVLNAFPEKEKVILFTSLLFNFLFPFASDKNEFHVLQEQKKYLLFQQLNELLAHDSIRQISGNDHVSGSFLSSLPGIKEKLLLDADLFIEFDPAATSLEEVVLTYPGFFAIAIHRLAHILYCQKVPLMPRMMAEWAHSKTGIDIHPGAQIGCPFFIDHGTGVVIGETSIIGNRVKIYQGVTLGALAVRKEDASIKRHPTIEDNVILYAGCSILGGETNIGHDCIIGGNTWITSSVKPFSVVYHRNQTIISDRNFPDEPIHFII